ncbi:MAG: NUDIX domain-containing protein [Parcubacteria group bacterium]|nr:NUDIX domain-containing protein [Parcubacteria group bacterium]
MKKHTLGFIFDPSLSKILLVQKQRPEWQKGKCNGIGGKIELGERSLDCIVRETHEETGLKINAEEWVYVGEIKSKEWNVDIYTTIYKGETSDATTITDEQIGWFETNNLPLNVIGNLKWLIPQAAYKLIHGEFDSCTAYYLS